MNSCKQCSKLTKRPVFCSKQCYKKYSRKTDRSKISKLICNARKRALVKNLDFCISTKDIKIPERCPILGTRLFFNGPKMSKNTPTIDRKDSSKGYTPDNIQIISFRANELKNNATKEEIRLLLEWMEKNVAE